MTLTVLGGLLALLVAARASGGAAHRLGLPAVSGELLAGVLLAGLIAFVGGVAPLADLPGSPMLDLVIDVAIFFLALLAGIDMRPAEIRNEAGEAFVIALGGLLLPLALGTGLGFLVLSGEGPTAVQALFIGTALSVTAIPATIGVLDEFGLLVTRLGRVIVSAAILDDVLGLIVLAVILALVETGGLPDPLAFLFLLAKIAAFFAVTLLLGAHVYPRISSRVRALDLAAAEFSALMIVALGYSLLADVLGLHWVLGAIVAGVFFEPDRVGPKAYNDMKLVVTGISNGFLGPLFFAAIGLQVDFVAALEAPVLIAALIALAFVGKFVGAALPAYLTGYGPRDSTAIGIGMNARGAVELIVIAIAVDTALFEGAEGAGASVISALVMMAIVTTLLTPVMLRLLLARRP